jgi:putative transposase
MKKSRFTEAQIVHALRRAEVGEAPKEIIREYGITEATFYAWKRKYAGLGVPELKRLKSQDEEISRLKRIVADLLLDKQILQEVLAKKL